MLYSGLDEAALGPTLGPFCACLTTFSIPGQNTPEPELYEIFSEIISPGKKIPGKLAVADSKILYSRSTGIRTLEKGVLTFLEAAGLSLPVSFTDLLSALSPPSDLKALKGIPWFEKAGDLTIPWNNSNSDTAETDSGLKTALESRGIEFQMPSLRFVPAREFNREILSRGGKGPGVRAIISPLLKEALSEINNLKQKKRITVDRQGGRKYYGEWLNELMPGSPLRAEEESPKRSAYTAGNRHIEFLVGADGIRMETALASMFAKYVRESAMVMFNQWWTERIPGIKPTAGYPQDARRFIGEIEAVGAMTGNRDLLIRRL